MCKSIAFGLSRRVVFRNAQFMYTFIAFGLLRIRFMQSPTRTYADTLFANSKSPATARLFGCFI